MPENASEACDVAVIGGGPGGSTAAALLAQARLQGDRAGEGAPSAFSYRRIAAADEPADVRAARRAATRCARSACSSPARISRPTTSAATTLSPSRARSATARRTPTRSGARISTRCCSSTRANAAPTRAKGMRWCGSSSAARRDSRLRRAHRRRARLRASRPRYVVDASGRDALPRQQEEAAAQERPSTRARRSSGISAAPRGARARTPATSASTASSTAGCG